MVESPKGSKTVVLFEKLGYDRSLEGDNGRSDDDNKRVEEREENQVRDLEVVCSQQGDYILAN